MFYIAKSLSISAIKRAIGHSQNLGSSLHINFFVTYSLFEKDKTKSIENLGWKKILQLFIISMEFCSKCSANYYYPTFPTNHKRLKKILVMIVMFEKVCFVSFINCFRGLWAVDIVDHKRERERGPDKGSCFNQLGYFIKNVINKEWVSQKLI